MEEVQSLSHTKWECKYHVICIPKYRKKAIFKGLRPHLGDALHELARQKESKILEGHLQSDHVHVLISIPTKYSVYSVIGYKKVKAQFTWPAHFATGAAIHFGHVVFMPQLLGLMKIQ